MGKLAWNGLNVDNIVKRIMKKPPSSSSILFILCTHLWEKIFNPVQFILS